MKRYSKEVHSFICENVKGTPAKELASRCNKSLGTSFTASSMRSYMKNHGLKSGTPRGNPKGVESRLYPRDVQEFIENHHKGTGPKDMTELLNKKFGKNYTKQQMKSYYHNHALNSGLDGRFAKGSIPPNKGKKGYHAPGSEKGWFPKGHIPANHKPLGSERIEKDGYVLIKTAEPNVYRAKHIILWEEANGPVPKGKIINFLDGNKQNLSLNNLVLVSREEHAVLNRRSLRFNDAELTNTGILIAKLKIATSKKRRENHE